MGAQTFGTMAQGANAQDAYKNAVQEALYESGHDPYNGTISTTEGFRIMNTSCDYGTPEFWAYVDEKINDFDKWGACGCVEIEKGKYYFFGWAAC